LISSVPAKLRQFGRGPAESFRAGGVLRQSRDSTAMREPTRARRPGAVTVKQCPESLAQFDASAPPATTRTSGRFLLPCSHRSFRS
jgi:hypothetical protein